MCSPSSNEVQAASQALEDFDNGEVEVPRRGAIDRAWIRLDCISVLWERAHAGVSYVRSIMADSSQKVWNYFMVCEKRVPRSDLISERSQADAFSWQCTTLGYGASNLAYKWRNLVHSMMMKCSCDEDLRTLRLSIWGFTSDFGTERKLADACFVAEPTLASLHEFCRDVCSHTKHIHVDGSEPNMHYLLPNCLAMQGHLHMIGNALEAAITKCRFWSGFEGGLRAMLSFLNNRDLRKRFKKVCLPPEHQHNLKRWNKELLDWRWQSLGDVCSALVPILPLLVQYFDASKLSTGGDIASLGSIDAVCISLTAKFLKLGWLEAIFELLRVIGKETSSFMSWLEGCQCHADIWQLPVSWEKRQRIFRERTGGLENCLRKGCRGDELATGYVQYWCERISTATSDHLTTLLQKLGLDHRNAVLATMANIRESLYEEFHAKLEHWLHLPYSILGLLASNLFEAKQCAKRCIEEFHAGEKSRHHRVTLRFFMDTVVGKQLVLFSEDSSSELAKYPELYELVLGYNTVPLVERRVEAEHAKVTKVMVLSIRMLSNYSYLSTI